MPGPANALNIGQQGTLYFDGVNTFSGIDASTQGHVLTSNGPGIPPSFLAPTGGSGFSSVNIQTFTASGTYTPSANMVYCIIEAVGGGGGGRGQSGDGGDGGTTTVGSLITCTGGKGGIQSPSVGGQGGTATGGDINLTGAAGNGGQAGQSGGSSFFGGAGSSSEGGGINAAANTGSGGGSYPDSNVAQGGGAGGYARLFADAATIGASQAITIGAGGAGGSVNGGAGAAGLVIVTEFIQDSADSPFYSLTPYIVGSDANSEYNTIQAAITQAVADGASSATPKNIYIKPGTYTENLTISDGINLIGFGGDVLLTGTPVVVSGNHTISGNWNAYNLTLNSANNALILFSGSGNIGIFRCYLQGSAIGVFDGGNTRVQAIFQSSIINAGGAIVKTANATTDLNAVFLYGTNVESGDYIFDLSDLNSSTTGASLTCINAYIENGIDFLTDPNSIAVVVGITAYNSRLPIGCTISATTAQINVSADNCSLTSSAISGGNNASNINLSNCTCFQAPSITNYDGGSAVWINLAISPNLSTASSNVNKYWTGIAAPLFLGSDQVSSQSCHQTTNATPFVLVSVPLNELESVTVTGTLVGSSADHTDSVGGTYSIVARRATGGNITIVGSATNNVQSTSTATFSVAVNTSTQAVELTITGIAATTYNWSSYYTFQKILLDS